MQQVPIDINQIPKDVVAHSFPDRHAHLNTLFSTLFIIAMAAGEVSAVVDVQTRCTEAFQVTRRP